MNSFLKKDRIGEETSYQNLKQLLSEVSPKGIVQLSLLASGRWTKISVRNTGVFKITNAELKRWDSQEPKKSAYLVMAVICCPNVSMNIRQLTYPKFLCLRLSDGVLFYGRGTVSWTPDSQNTYFVRERNFLL